VRQASLVLLVLVALLTTGCAGIAVGALGAAVISSGAGSALRAGTEYTLGGTAYRTFTLSLEDLAAIVRRTLDRMELPVVEARADGASLIVRADGIDREVRLTFTPISPATTRLGVTVKQDLIRRDRATASEVVAQVEQSLTAAKSASR